MRYSNTQRSKFYKVKAKVRLSTTKKDIPTGKTKSAMKERKALIKKSFPAYYGTYYCAALKADVAVNSNISLHKAIDEPSKTAKSTMLTLMLKDIVGKAEIIYEDTPKDNVGQKSFSKIIVLAAIVKGVGYAKLTIGKYKEGASDTKALFCHYCIRHLSVHELKNKK